MSNSKATPPSGPLAEIERLKAEVQRLTLDCVSHESDYIYEIEQRDEKIAQLQSRLDAVLALSEVRPRPGARPRLAIPNPWATGYNRALQRAKNAARGVV